MVSMLEAKMLPNSSSSFKNHRVFSRAVRLASRSKANQSLLSLADFNDV